MSAVGSRPLQKEHRAPLVRDRLQHGKRDVHAQSHQLPVEESVGCAATGGVAADEQNDGPEGPPIRILFGVGVTPAPCSVSAPLLLVLAPVDGAPATALTMSKHKHRNVPIGGTSRRARTCGCVGAPRPMLVK